MICRLWRGWAARGRAADYEALLVEQIVPGIFDRAPEGLVDLSVLRHREAQAGAPVEFATVMRFENWSAVEAFAGPDPTAAVVPPDARVLLERFDQRSAHYDLVRRYGQS